MANYSFTMLLGALMYWRRSRPSPRVPPAQRPSELEFQADPESIREDIAGRSSDSIYLEGANLVKPFIEPTFPLEPPLLARGLALLEHVVTLDPKNWAAMWFLGGGYRRTESFKRSHEYFQRAYALAPDRLETVVEYQQACLLLGRIDDAIPLGERQIVLAKGSAAARSNHAITLLLAGDLDGAQQEANAAVAAAPEDEVIRRVCAIITEVSEGRRPRPRSLRDFAATRAPVPVPPQGLTRAEAEAGFEEAFSKYRVILQADPVRLIAPDERLQFEAAFGPIERIEIAASGVDLSWLGRRVSADLTEHTTVLCADGELRTERRLRMQIVEREGGWGVERSWILPTPGRDERQGGGSPPDLAH